MKLSMTYRVRTRGFNHIFDETVRLYRQAVSFFVDVCLTEWNLISTGKLQKERVNLVESLTVRTRQNPAVPYDFSAEFYKFPCYLRRAAIAEALGKVYPLTEATWQTGKQRIRQNAERNRHCHRWDTYIRPCTVPVCLSVPVCIRRR